MQESAAQRRSGEERMVWFLALRSRIGANLAFLKAHLRMKVIQLQTPLALASGF